MAGYSDYVDGLPTRKPDGTLTDWGKKLAGISEIEEIAKNYKQPKEYNSDKGLYGGLAPTYEAYVAQNLAMGNSAMNIKSREDWQREVDRVYYGKDDVDDSPQRTLANLQQQQAINALQQAQNNALNPANSITGPQKQQVKQNYYNLRNNANVASQLGAKSFAEYMAQRGQTRAGAAMQGELNRQGQLQNVMTNLGIAENQAYADIDRAEAERQLAEKQRQEDIAREQARWNQQMEYQRQRDAQADSRYWADWAAQQQLQQQQLQQSLLNQQKNDYLSTIGQFSNNYQAEINRVQNDGDPSNDWQIAYLQAERQKKIAQAQAQYQKQGIITPDLAPILGLPVGTMLPWYEQQLRAAEQAAQEKAAQQAFENYLKQQELELKKKQTNYNTSKPYYAPKSSSSGNYGLNW